MVNLSNRIETISVLIASLCFVLHFDLAQAQTNRKLIKLVDVSETAADSVSVPQLSPDGKFVVYNSNPINQGASDLFSIAIDGTSPPNKLSGYLVSGRSASNFVITPNSKRVVYRSNPLRANKFEIFSVPIDRSSVPIRLNIPLPRSSNDVLRFSLTADGSKVIYLADPEVNGEYELFVVPVAGGPSVKITGRSPDTAGVEEDFAISHNGQHVVYRAKNRNDDNINLYSVRIDGSQRINLSNLGSTETTVLEGFKISNLSDRAVYQVAEGLGSSSKLLSVPLNGGSSSQLGLNLPSSNAPLINQSFDVSADGRYVVFRDNASDLFSVSIEGNQLSQLNNAESFRDDVQSFEISPNNDYVVYRSRFSESRFSSSMTPIFSVAIDGSTGPELLSRNNSNGRVQRYNIDNEGKTVVFQQSRFPDIEFGSLYSVPISGGTITNLSRNFGSTSLSTDFVIDSESSTVFMTLVINNSGQNKQLYLVGIDGTRLSLINGAIRRSSIISRYQIHPGGGSLIYIVNKEIGGDQQLFSLFLNSNLIDSTDPIIQAPLSIVSALAAILALILDDE